MERGDSGYESWEKNATEVRWKWLDEAITTRRPTTNDPNDPWVAEATHAKDGTPVFFKWTASMKRVVKAWKKWQARA